MMGNGQGKADKEKGDRAEQIVSWYFRLNGFLSIPGFVVHSGLRAIETEADLMAVRFPYSAEKIRIHQVEGYPNSEKYMEDDPRIIKLVDPNPG